MFERSCEISAKTTVCTQNLFDDLRFAFVAAAELTILSHRLTNCPTLTPPIMTSLEMDAKLDAKSAEDDDAGWQVAGRGGRAKKAAESPKVADRKLELQKEKQQAAEQAKQDKARVAAERKAAAEAKKAAGGGGGAPQVKTAWDELAERILADFLALDSNAILPSQATKLAVANAKNEVLRARSLVERL